MLQTSYFVLILILLASCSNKENDDVDFQKKIKADTSSASQPVLFGQPHLIDSSAIVIFPLILDKTSTKDDYLKSSGGQVTNYWNLVFYHTGTSHQQLLVNNRKVLIHGFYISASYSSEIVNSYGINIYRNNILYDVVTKDYNENKQLDLMDPSYLFISNRDGTGFRQLSPDDHHVQSWQVVTGTSKILLILQKDANADKTFNEKDPFIHYIVDTESPEKASEIFSKEQTDSLQKQMVSIWSK